nr:hypothetical protein [uncultured Cohaesibacter sp.]
MRLLFAILVAIVLAEPVFGQTAAPIPDGAYGGACRADGMSCDSGLCDQTRNLCVSCGLEGAPACIGHDGKPVCIFPSYGYRPLSLGGRQLYCFTRNSKDCGHVGLSACENGAIPVCYFGIRVVASDGQSFCAACGDYGQPCCADASCAYGTCQNDVCLPDKPAGGASQPSASGDQQAKSGSDKATILAAVADCRLTEARALHASIDPNVAWYDEVTRVLLVAVERENKVRTLYDRAIVRQASAQRMVGQGDHDNALQDFLAAGDLLRDAQRLSQCKPTLEVIAEAIVINRRSSATTRAVAQVALAEKDIGLCDFSIAQELLDGVPVDTPRRAVVLQKLAEARDREGRVERMYDAARNLHRLADERVRAGQPGQALEMLQDARQGLVNARQLTDCRNYRDRISDALRVIGGSIEMTESRVKAAEADRIPQRYDGPSSPAPVDPGQPVAGQPHPCRDNSVPVDASASFYAQYSGGGGSYMIKRPYLCDPPYIDIPFAVLGGGSMTLYACARKGDHFVNCQAKETITFTDIRPEGKGTGYFWGKEGAWRWMVIVDH